MSLPTAVCLLVPRTVRVLVPGEAEQFLVISRRNDFTRWGLPGGKVDAGESDIRAVQRETFEETGLIGPSASFQRFIVVSAKVKQRTG